MTRLTYSELAEFTGHRTIADVPCPLCGPVRRSPANRKRKVLRIWRTEHGFASYHCARCGEEGYAHDKLRQAQKQTVGLNRGGYAGLYENPASIEQPTLASQGIDKNRAEFALGIWGETVPLLNTLAWRYYTERRGLHIGSLELEHVLRWHQGISAVVALMTDPTTNEPTGIHRTVLNRDGTKRERKMLGKQGVIRLTPDDEVTAGLGLTEGVEDGLAVLLSGWAPVWCATSAGAIERFPTLRGVEALTVFADDDPPGMKAAHACVTRWNDAGCEARISGLKDLRS